VTGVGPRIRAVSTQPQGRGGPLKSGPICVIIRWPIG